MLILGGGFAGLTAARELAKAPVDVTLVDRMNHHLFQPLLYQVATGSLAPSEIAVPIRRVLRKQDNAEVVLGEVRSIDLDARKVEADTGTFAYDVLLIACGVDPVYFGNDGWREHAPPLKTVDDALLIRRRVLLAYEEAEREEDEEARRADLTFVIVGGGPTGVELAGALAEAARLTLPHDFRHIDTRTTRVILVEGENRLLPALPADLGERARRDLASQGVDIRLSTRAEEIDGEGVRLGDERIPAQNVIWAAGVGASPLLRNLGPETDRAGRLKVGADLTLPGHPEVFVLGDAAHAEDPATGKPVPGLAPAAIQMGRYAARTITREAKGRSGPREPFRYHDKGDMAVIRRGKAVARLRSWNFGGLAAWFAWALIHIYFLIGFRRRLLVFLEWVWSFLFYVRGTRLITGSPRPRLRRPR